MRVKVALLTASLLLWGCSAGGGQNLTIADAERAGFEKDRQQMFQMIGAKDGWSGKWAGETVELYEYGSAEEVDPKVFESSVQEGNLSGWVELCQHKNMLMLSKGRNACQEIKGVSSN